MEIGKTKGKKIWNQNEEKGKNLQEAKEQQEKMAYLNPMRLSGIIPLILDGSKSDDHSQ
jgi:hypothetical protein